jgi:hypothetical protein
MRVVETGRRESGIAPELNMGGEEYGALNVYFQVLVCGAR